MGRGVDRQKLADWQRRMVRYEQTGLTPAEFCRREGVSVSVFRYWQRRVRWADRNSGGPQPRSQEVPAFAAIEIIPRRSVFVRVPGGASLEIPDDRTDLVRLALDRLAVNMEPAEC